MTPRPPAARRDLRRRAGCHAGATGELRSRAACGGSLDRDRAVRTECLNEPAAAGDPRRGRLREALALLALFALLLPSGARAQTPAGTPIPNTAYATYDAGTVVGIVRPSNTLVLTTAPFGTSSNLAFMRYAPAAPGATSYSVTPTGCFTGGSYVAQGPPLALGGSPIALASVDLVVTASYHTGEPVFVRLTDPDQNRNIALVESVVVSLATAAAGDAEQLQLYETGPSTGVFVGYVPSAASPAASNDCVLAGPQGAQATGSYTDAANGSDTSSASAVFDPQSRVFDSRTGQPVNGAQITLVDDATGLPAAGILGDDGVSAFPATVVSGGTVSDGGGQVYAFGAGGFRFPYVPPGTYRLQVVPPGQYTFPTLRSDAQLQALPGAPFDVAVGSRGEAFALPAGGTFELDLPLDPESEFGFVSIRASRDLVAVGEFLQYDVRVENPGISSAPGGVAVTVTLPAGFRFMGGSVRLDDAKSPDPQISPDGRTLTWTLPASALPEVTHIRFTTKVLPASKPGANSARAHAEAVGGTRTHNAVAVVRVEEDLGAGKSYILGRVSAGSCDSDDFGGEALSGVRVYLEDGTYAVTDENGYYHFVAVRPGSHVVQMDVASLPAFFEPLPCASAEGQAFAGRPFSQFADLGQGSMWRSDFRVQLRPRQQGAVNQRLESQLVDGVIHYQLALRGSGVGLRNVRAVMMLPEGTRYVPGSARDGGVAIEDPQVDGNVLTFRLGERENADWSMDLALDAVPEKPDDALLETSSVVMFETPVEKLAKTPVAKTQLKGESSSGSGMQVIETLGLRPGETWRTAEEGDALPAPKKPQIYDREWLEQATPGFEWLSPEPGFAAPIASVHIAIKHLPDTRLELLQNGSEVSRFNYEGTWTNAAKTVALSRWRGVDLVEGDNAFVARELDAAGTELATLDYSVHYAGPPLRAELAPELSTLVADGRTNPVIAVRLFDKDGKPGREGQVGEFSIDPPYTPALDPSVAELRRQAGLRPEAVTYRIGKDGVALIPLAPTTVSGKATLRIQLAGRAHKELHPWLEADVRDWVLVGLADGTVAHQDVSSHMESLVPSGVEDGFDLERGTTFFAKGRVKGSWLLTAAYDTRRESNELSDPINRAALEGGLDPNAYYTLYGDSSTQGVEAPSQRPLYVKLERKQFYALFGDYQTGLTVTELSRYSRTLNGVKTEFENEHATLAAFGTDTSQAFVQDEIRGDGTSGLYRLSRSDVVLNSERVRIEVRDRFHGQQVITSEPQARYVDYNIDYAAGTIFFKRPIPSTGEGFNPVFIVVEYESDDDSDKQISGGGRGSLKFLDESLELGASALHEGTLGRESSLYGSDLRYDFDDFTRFRAEYATTRSALVDPTSDPNGGAWLAELARRDEALTSRLYYRQQQPGFGLGQQSASETDMQQMGLDARYQWSDVLALGGQAFRQVDLASDARRDLFEGRLERKWGSLLSYGGGRWANDRFSDGTDTTAQQLLGGASWTTYQNRLKLRGDSEVDVGGDESMEFPTRFLVGADFELFPDLTVFGEEELALASERSTASTRVGLRTSPWQGGQMTAALGRQTQQDVGRLFTTLGMMQTYQATDALSFDFSVDNSTTIDGNDLAPAQVSPFGSSQPVSFGLAGNQYGDDFTSVSLGTSYAKDAWAANVRVETRFGDETDKWGITAGAYRELQAGIGVAAKLQLFDTSGSNPSLVTGPTYTTTTYSSDGGVTNPNTSLSGIESLGRLKLSAVYRPVGGRITWLDALEFRGEKMDQDVFDSRSNRILNNMNLNVKLDRKTQASLYYGAKYVIDRIDGDRLTGYTDAVSLELRRDLFGGWDIGARAGLRHSWADGSVNELYSMSVGYVLMKNLWVSVGYNWGGYRDRDFSRSDWTDHGPFLSFRYKFDQETVKELLDFAE